MRKQGRWLLSIVRQQIIVPTLMFFLLLASFGLVRADVQELEDYVLGIGDVLEITARNHPELNRTVTILPDGTISYPGLGQVKAAGRSRRNLASQIQTFLEETENQVFVTISVTEIHSRRIRLVGAVKNSNEYDLKSGWRILDALSVAGGLTARPARITGHLVRKNGKSQRVNIATLMQSPDTPENVKLEPDDLILLEEADPAQSKVFVLGQVTKPGAFEISDEGTTLLSLIAQAGNTTERAALTRAYILRNGERIPLNLHPLLIAGKLETDIKALRLHAGDVLFIPEIEARIAVMGQVNKPGYYPLPETRETRVLDALSLGGGQTQNGDLRRAGIIRHENGQARVIPIDIEMMMKKGKQETNIPLLAGDILFIASRTEPKFSWATLLNPLSALSYMGLRILR